MVKKVEKKGGRWAVPTRPQAVSPPCAPPTPLPTLYHTAGLGRLGQPVTEPEQQGHLERLPPQAIPGGPAKTPRVSVINPKPAPDSLCTASRPGPCGANWTRGAAAFSRTHAHIHPRSLRGQVSGLCPPGGHVPLRLPCAEVPG